MLDGFGFGLIACPHFFDLPLVGSEDMAFLKFKKNLRFELASEGAVSAPGDLV